LEIEFECVPGKGAVVSAYCGVEVSAEVGDPLRRPQQSDLREWRRHRKARGGEGRPRWTAPRRRARIRQLRVLTRFRSAPQQPYEALSKAVGRFGRAFDISWW